MGAMLPPIPPSDATEFFAETKRPQVERRLLIATRTFYQHPVRTAVLRLTPRAARQIPTEYW